jgi:hypothetical protein
MTDTMSSSLSRCSTVRLFVYAGRPDPEFELDDAAAAELLDRLGRIPQGQRPEAIEAVAPPPPQLGYRGLLVRLAGGELEQLLVYGGVIRFRRDGRQFSWRDTEGIEQGLLEEAVRRGHQDLLESVGVRVSEPLAALRSSAGSS